MTNDHTVSTSIATEQAMSGMSAAASDLALGVLANEARVMPAFLPKVISASRSPMTDSPPVKPSGSNGP